MLAIEYSSLQYSISMWLSTGYFNTCARDVSLPFVVDIGDTTPLCMNVYICYKHIKVAGWSRAVSAARRPRGGNPSRAPDAPAAEETHVRSLTQLPNLGGMRQWAIPTREHGERDGKYQLKYQRGRARQ